jgi:hypothetical protein
MEGVKTVFFNKVMVCGHLEVWVCWAVELLLVGHGGKGRRRSGEFISASLRWRDYFLLQHRAHHAVPMIASTIFG